jgi:hypothetical protein
MQEVSPRHAGLAVLRVWVEDGSPEVRARLTTVDDVSIGARKTVRWTGAGSQQILLEVRSWLEEWERSVTRAPLTDGEGG